MELVNVREIFKNTIRYENQQVTIGGWVRSNRNSKNFGFIVVNDGTFFEPIQVVYGDGLENYEEVCKINVGAAVIVKGQLVPTPEAKHAEDQNFLPQRSDFLSTYPAHSSGARSR